MADEKGPISTVWVAMDGGGVEYVEERGLGRQEVELVRCLYCMTKPIVALAATAIIERSGIDPTGLTVDVDGRIGRGGPWSLVDVLSQTTRLTVPRIWQAIRFPQNELVDRLDTALRTQASGHVRKLTGYSDVLCGLLLTRAAEALLGWPLADVLHEEMQAVAPHRPLWFAPTRDLLNLPEDAIAVGYSVHEGRRYPLVHERTRRARAETSTFLYAYGSLAAVGDWYRAAILPPVTVRSARLVPSTEFLAVLANPRPRPKDGAPFYDRGLCHRRTASGAEVVGHDAAGCSLAIYTDIAARATVTIVGDTFLEAPDRRRRWFDRELAAAMTWASSGAVHA